MAVRFAGGNDGSEGGQIIGRIDLKVSLCLALQQVIQALGSIFQNAHRS